MWYYSKSEFCNSSSPQVAYILCEFLFYKECHSYVFPKTTCGSSNATIMVNLDGKEIGEIVHVAIKPRLGGAKYNYTPKEKSKVFELKFHQGSKIEFLLAAKIINGHDSNGKPNGYGAAIKFKSFKIDQCFSKCE